MSTGNSSAYRPDIDGLRAVAVLGVVFFHAGLGVSGGFAGVDVFFVISGYLITGIIMRELGAGTFRFSNFWERRVRRILPALVATQVVTVIVGYFLLFPEQFTDLAKSVLSLAVFSSNIFFWLGDSYFAAESESKPLLHTWSLSVEEQFYLFMPLTLWLLYKLWRGWLIPLMMAAGFLVSLGLSIWALNQIQYVSATFFLLPTRAWELLAGALLAVAPAPCNERLRVSMASSGLVMILLTFFVYSPKTPFPGAAALLPVAGTVLVIWGGAGAERADTLVQRLLSWRPLVFIGLISYSLYLVHWPLFAFYFALFGKVPPLPLAVVFIALSIALAVLSWRYIETPFRRRTPASSQRKVFLGGAMTTLLLCSGAWFVVRAGGIESRFGPEVLRILEANAARRELPQRSMAAADVPEGLARIGAEGGAAGVFLWGDSHADAVMPGVDLACRTLGLAGQAATAWVTPPVKDWYKPHGHGLNAEAPAYNRLVMDHIRRLTVDGRRPTVILAGNWVYYLEDPADREAFAAAMAGQIEELRQAGCRVVVLKQFPFYRDNVPRNLALKLHFGSEIFDLSMSNAEFLSQREPQEKVFSEIASRFPDVLFVDPRQDFLGPDGDMRQVCEDGEPLYADHGHVSPHGAERIAPRFVEAIRAAAGRVEPKDPQDGG